MCNFHIEFNVVVSRQTLAGFLLCTTRQDVPYGGFQEETNMAYRHMPNLDTSSHERLRGEAITRITAYKLMLSLVSKICSGPRRKRVAL